MLAWKAFAPRGRQGRGLRWNAITAATAETRGEAAGAVPDVPKYGDAPAGADPGTLPQVVHNSELATLLPTITIPPVPPTPAALAAMDGFVASESPTPNRQSLLGNLLRGRPRGASQSQQQQQQGQSQEHHRRRDPSPPTANRSPSIGRRNTAASPAPTHRRRGAGGPGSIIVQPTPPQAGSGTFQMLRRRRSANNVSNPAPAPAVAVSRPSTSSGPANASPPNPPPPASPVGTAASAPTNPILPPAAAGHADPSAAPPPAHNPALGHRIRLVPHLDSTRSLHFVPIQRDVKEGDTPLRIGRFTDRANAAPAANASNKLAFKSKVVSRAHAEIWCEAGPRFFIRDTKSSSGTFLNHVRLSPPNSESKPSPIKDGDILQLGVDYQGGTEDIYKCVRIRIEMGREWQTAPNAFNTNAMNQLKALAGAPVEAPGKKSTAHIADCCICLFQVSLHQSLFIAPCSHVFHYKCLRPLLQMHHPGFTCPLCRTFANLEEDVELEPSADGAFEAAASAALGFPTQTGHSETEAMHLAMALSTAAASASAAGDHPMSPITAGAETEVETDVAPRTVGSRTHTHIHTLTPRFVSGRRSVGEFGGTVVGVPDEEDEEDDDGVMVDDEDGDGDGDGDEVMGDASRTSPTPSPPPSASAVRGGALVTPADGAGGLEALLALHASTSARMEAEHRAASGAGRKTDSSSEGSGH